MGIQWHCDKTGRQTYINPPQETVMQEVKDDKGKVVLGPDKQPIMEPVMVEIDWQNPETGVVEKKKVPKVKYLKEKAYIVRLRVGDQLIQRDFCEEGLQHLQPELDALWKKMKEMKSK